MDWIKYGNLSTDIQNKQAIHWKSSIDLLNNQRNMIIFIVC